MGLLDILNNPDNAQALGLLGQGIANRNVTGGANAAMGLLAGADQRRLQQQMMQMQMEAQRAQMEDMQRQRTTQASLLDAARQSVISPDKATAMSMGPMPDGSNMPTVQPGLDTSSFINRAFQIDPFKAIELQGQLVKQKPAPIKLGAGDALVDPQTFKPLFTAPNKPAEQPSAVREYEYARQQGYQGTFQQFQTDMKKAITVKVEVPINMGQKGLDNELKIKSDFRSEPIYKAHNEVQSAHSQITAAIKQNSPAGDLAAATKIMKILDPGSVVRESELGMAMAATGLMDRVQNFANMIATGQKLTPSQRKDFQSLADRLYTESAGMYNAKRNEYAGFARDYKLDEQRIVGPAVTSPKLPGAKSGPRFLGFE